MPALLLDDLTLINETERERREKIREEEWHWYSRLDGGWGFAGLS